MHCLGAASGVDSASPSGTSTSTSSSSSSSSSSPSPAAAGGVCSRGAVMSVVRALGVLVCEGRLQGPPRGYREGPHCAAPLQPLTNDHVCDKDSYLCARYIVLVREIAERIIASAPLSVEVSMSTDCPCGLARATCKNPAAPSLTTSGPLTQWQLLSDVLLEYWSISVVPSKNSETMNAQGLYQAVRSRLHFSQVAAWWSRSNGTRPSYVTTRIVPHEDENLRKFRGIPIEHTFPLAAIGDGNSIKVTVWALPRMEEVPTLFCPLHPTKDNEDAARALTPTKIGPLVASSNPQAVENLVLPVLVDDRLQTACDKPGKHHCHCEDEETSPSSMMIMMMRPNGERKRRRSLPCGPTGHETTPSSHHTQIALTPVRETGNAASLQETTINSLLYANNNNNNNNSAGVSNRNEVYENTYLSTGSLERRFRKQASLEETRKDSEAEQTQPSGLDPEDEGNEEKRYKPSIEGVRIPEESVKRTSSSSISGGHTSSETATRRDNVPNNLKASPACTVHRHYPRIPRSPSSTDRGNDLTELMSKLSFPGDKKPREDRRRIPDWLGETPSGCASTGGRSRRPEEETSDVKLRNCSLELSQREFNEVLAVLRARTPITRRRAPPRSLRRRERGNEDVARSAERDGVAVCPVHRDKRRLDRCNCESRVEEPPTDTARGSLDSRANSHRPSDALLGAILRTSERSTGLADVSNGARPRKAAALIGTNKPTEIHKNEEHERYLPNVFNKRLSRLRQLFQKELDQRSLPEPINNRETVHHGIPEETNCTRRPIQPRNGAVDAPQLLSYPAKSHATPIQLNRHANHPQINNGQIPLRSRRNESVENIEDETSEKGVPSASEQEQFRRSFENAASMVFHSRTGLPLTSSPAPLRRGHCCFDYDSTLNSVSSKRSALFELNTPPSPGAVSLEETDREVEISGEGDETPKRQSTTRIRPQSHALLGSFEESALNGRLEPVSTVHGFTAELGASGSFCPKHRKLPVTVFFYTLGDNDKVSTPYLAHINLGKKGYQVPRSGTIQVTLLNPLGTVVKMFVVLYDLSDMPPRSHTFLRQRTLRDKTLRYLVHLRFMSGKSGRIYLHTDIRMIICRKSDVDTASDFGSEPPKELRSYIHGPTNPKFSPRC